jgi:ComF family protein
LFRISYFDIRVWLNIKDLVFPRFCCGCGVEGDLLCRHCLEEIKVNTQAGSCVLCRNGTKSSNLCAGCRRATALDDLICVGEFKGEIRDALHVLKYEDVRAVASVLARLLFDRCQVANLSAGLIVPVPLHPNRERERGYNQSGLIAQVLAKQSGWLFLDALAKIKNTQRQTKLSRDQRLENLKGAYRPKFDLSDYRKPIYLVDDVLTTGATLSAAARALKQAGARRLRGLIVAKG